jgi:hypothetical protein
MKVLKNRFILFKGNSFQPGSDDLRGIAVIGFVTAGFIQIGRESLRLWRLAGQEQIIFFCAFRRNNQ